MPYGTSGRLPGETASKLGHLSVIQSEWVRSLIDEFEAPDSHELSIDLSIWQEYESTGQPLKYIFAVDGSIANVKGEGFWGKEVAFIKTALVSPDKNKMDKIDKLNPHPLLMQDLMKDTLFHATVLPLKNVKTKLGNNYDSVRNIVFDSMKCDEKGAYFETLKWLAYEKWSITKGNSPEFDCPHCGKRINGLPYDASEGACQNCGGQVFLTDMLGFHLDMLEDSAPEKIATAYMLIMETLMLLTVARIFWSHSNKDLFSDALFIKDGPLSFSGQYVKLVPNIRNFIEYTKRQGRPINIIGQEKSGAFYDHLTSITKYLKNDVTSRYPKIAVLSHGFVHDSVYRTPDLGTPYGKRTNWGEKVYVQVDPTTNFVLNIPTGKYNDDTNFPKIKDIIGLDRIIATLPSLISRRYESALFPIELAHGVASLSSYPSAKILERFLENK